MPAGGQRVGSGRKPTKPRIFKPAVLVGGQAGTDGGVSAVPPSDLPAEQRDFWGRYAGLAIEKRTLTTHTEAAFLLLCRVEAHMRAMWAVIEADGLTFTKVSVDVTSSEQHTEIKAHPLLGAHGRQEKQVETLMARFGLAPFGKAEIPLARKAAVNPWASVAQK